MTDEPRNQQTQLAIRIAQEATPDENAALRKWASDLLVLRDKDLPALVKGKDAIRLTIKSKVAWPATKIMAREIKKHGWDKRNATTKVGLTGAALGLAFFPGAGAGIAALGGAVGVPLWVVMGGGAMFAKVLLTELVAKTKRDIAED
jgi:hypothetical protein